MKTFSPRIMRTLLIGLSAALLLLIAMLPGDWEVYGAPPLADTPRGTAPLPPGFRPTETPTQAPTPTQQPGGLVPSPVTQPTAPGATPTPGQQTPVANPSAPPVLKPSDSIARPMATTTSAVVQQGQETRLVSGDGSVVVTLAPSSGLLASQLTYVTSSLPSDARDAAQKGNILITNRIFRLSLDAAFNSLPQLTISLTYEPSQISGILPQSLALYHFDEQALQWKILQSCVVTAAANRVQCQSDAVGLFMLGGALASDATSREQSQSPDSAAFVLGGMVVAGLGIGIAVWLWKRPSL